jgi:hypothetical protein
LAFIPDRCPTGAERSETASRRLPRRGERREAARSNRLLSEQAGSVFEGGKSREVEDFDKEREGLHSKIGELTVQLDFVVKKSKQLGVWSGLPTSLNLNTRA